MFYLSAMVMATTIFLSPPAKTWDGSPDASINKLVLGTAVVLTAGALWYAKTKMHKTDGASQFQRTVTHFFNAPQEVMLQEQFPLQNSNDIGNYAKQISIIIEKDFADKILSLTSADVAAQSDEWKIILEHVRHNISFQKALKDKKLSEFSSKYELLTEAEYKNISRRYDKVLSRELELEQ